MPAWSPPALPVPSLVCAPLPEAGVEPAGRGCEGITGWWGAEVCVWPKHTTAPVTQAKETKKARRVVIQINDQSSEVWLLIFDFF